MMGSREQKALRASHEALNDLLALFWRECREVGYSTADRALDALARNLSVMPDLPVTAAFAKDVQSRSSND